MLLTKLGYTPEKTPQQDDNVVRRKRALQTLKKSLTVSTVE